MAKKKKKSKKTPPATTTPKKAENKTTAPKETKNPKKKAADQRKDHINGIIKTLYPAVLGVLFGFISFYAFGAAVSDEGSVGVIYPWYFIMMIVITATYYVQRYTYPFLKIKADEFEGKDWLYVEFIAVDLWLVSWTLLLN